MKIGSFVECIDDKFSAEQLSKLNKIPKQDEYYTIRDIVDYPEFSRTGVRLEEIANPDVTREDGVLFEPTFNIHRFRELEIPPPFEEDIAAMLDNELIEELIEIGEEEFKPLRNL
jgi:hypothetical protein